LEVQRLARLEKTNLPTELEPNKPSEDLVLCELPANGLKLEGEESLEMQIMGVEISTTPETN
jgi:hypothetical protein